jgi:hypothetical protein
MDEDKEITIADLYPDFTPEQQEEAKQNWLAYLKIVKRIFDRLVEEGRLEEVLQNERLRKEWEKGRGIRK